MCLLLIAFKTCLCEDVLNRIGWCQRQLVGKNVQLERTWQDVSPDHHLSMIHHSDGQVDSLSLILWA